MQAESEQHRRDLQVFVFPNSLIAWTSIAWTHGLTVAAWQIQRQTAEELRLQLTRALERERAGMDELEEERSRLDESLRQEAEKVREASECLLFLFRFSLSRALLSCLHPSL